MKLSHSIYYILALLLSPAIHAIPYISFRSQSTNNARQLVGWNREINRTSQDALFMSFNVASEYTRSFNNAKLTECLFGNDIVCNSNACGDALTISGYNVPNRGANDWFAPYFGLPLDYKSFVQFNPRVDNFIIDFSLFIGLNNILEGLFIRLHAPFVHNRRYLNMRETIQKPGSINYPQGWYGPHINQNNGITTGISSATPETLNHSFTDYITGKTPTLPDNITWKPLCCSAIFFDCNQTPMTRNGFGELQMIFGWNFIQEKEYHLGLGLFAAAPTGTRPENTYLFSPVIGNGKHWEVGGHVSAHYLFWSDESDDQSFGFYLDGHVSHLFNSHQTRCFDLCNKPNSRYMLAEKLGSSRQSPQLVNNPTVPLDLIYENTNADAGVEFQNEFSPVANITKLSITSNFKIQGDVAAMFEYQIGGITVDLGYNFWAMSCERICIDECCPKNFAENTWALKGDAFVVGFEGSTTNPTTANDRLPVRLAATDSKATIYRGSKGSVEQPSNDKADNPALAFTNNSGMLMINQNFPVLSRTNSEVGNVNQQARSSNEPIYIKESDIDLAGNRGLSHKVFAHVNYTWTQKDSAWIPYIGFGGEVEFGKTENNCDDACDTACSTDPCDVCHTCIDCALSQWGIWIKLGLTYY